MPFEVVTANVNGVRAAARRGGMEWLASCGADVLCLQEVRATREQLDKVLADAGMAQWHVELAEGARNGHAGVALLSRSPLGDVRVGLGDPQLDVQGRWIEATVTGLDGTEVRLASVYVHTGESHGPRREEKDRFLSLMGRWMAANRARPALVCGDLNVAHTSSDIKNWRANRGRAGFLDSERAHLDRWYDPSPAGLGWVDLGRRIAGERPGPYTWWSWRGRGFDTDGGWRIDVVLASPAIAGRAQGIAVHKAATYAQRWSDHAAVGARFE